MENKRIRLNQNEKQVLFLIQDLIKDPVKISVDADIETKELEKILGKLEKLKFIRLKKRGKKIFEAKATKEGQDFFDNKMRRFYY